MARLRKPRSDVERYIERAVDEGNQLLLEADEVTDDESSDRWTKRVERWHARTREALRVSFEEEEASTEFLNAATLGIYRQVGQPESLTFRYRQDGIRAGINTLVSLAERLEFAEEPFAQAGGKPSPNAPSTLPPTSRRVFVVHGRDEGLREQVARLLDRLGFEPLILAEQPNQGRTLIEKFEAGALDVGFAVVVLWPDDYARGPEGAEFPDQPNRARQNVILELGYFMGSLGRSRVAALYKPGTDLPSDIHGLAYIPIDEGGAWRLRVARELAAADYDVDLNRLA